MSTENIVTGKFYRILKDKTNDIWDRISLWTHSDDVETASGITLTNDLTTKDNKITATQNDFGTVETSSVSAHAYVKGNLLLYNNQLYRAKTAIAVGATLTEGTNIESVSVGTLSNMLTATNGNQFYFDVKDGTPGFYPSASKTASQFVPFGGTGIDTVGTYYPNTTTTASDSTGQSRNVKIGDFDKDGYLVVHAYLYSSSPHSAGRLRIEDSNGNVRQAIIDKSYSPSEYILVNVCAPVKSGDTLWIRELTYQANGQYTSMQICFFFVY